MSLHGVISPDPVVSRVVIAERGIHIVKHGSGARGPFGARHIYWVGTTAVAK